MKVSSPAAVTMVVTLMLEMSHALQDSFQNRDQSFFKGRRVIGQIGD